MLSCWHKHHISFKFLEVISFFLLHGSYVVIYFLKSFELLSYLNWETSITMIVLHTVGNYIDICFYCLPCYIFLFFQCESKYNVLKLDIQLSSSLHTMIQAFVWFKCVHWLTFLLFFWNMTTTKISSQNYFNENLY